jgi:hypothetical protein
VGKVLEEENEMSQNENRKSRPSVADLEKRLEILERRVAILEARQSDQVRANLVEEGEDVEQHLDDGVAEETVRVHDVEIS